MLRLKLAHLTATLSVRGLVAKLVAQGRTGPEPIQKSDDARHEKSKLTATSSCIPYAMTPIRHVPTPAKPVPLSCVVDNISRPRSWSSNTSNVLFPPFPCCARVSGRMLQSVSRMSITAIPHNDGQSGEFHTAESCARKWSQPSSSRSCYSCASCGRQDVPSH
ncbi:hypothetical protein IWZ00DRAFT_321256 [Phyllosticta capitalensis]